MMVENQIIQEYMRRKKHTKENVSKFPNTPGEKSLSESLSILGFQSRAGQES
jgi:hypothetical protein